jgi:hypothetical protein
LENLKQIDVDQDLYTLPVTHHTKTKASGILKKGFDNILSTEFPA